MTSRAAGKQLGVGKSTINDARARVKNGDSLPVTVPKGLRILALDLETSPALADVWKMWDNNIGLNQLRAVTEVICFGARWLGEDETVVYSTFIDGKEAMVQRAWELLDEADAVMGWNSKNFDVKHLNREFILAGLTPPSPFVNLDLMMDVKSKFRFLSNKLDHVAHQLLGQEKVKHEGHTLWVKCMAGDAQAWLDMYEYQRQDVDLLIDLYHKLLPWLKSHPNAALYNGQTDSCVRCGSLDLLRSARNAYTTVSVFPMYVCETCGTHQRGAKSLSTSSQRKLTS